MDIAILYTTVSNATEAQHLATMLVSQKLAACANILPQIQSIYLWNETLQSEEEYGILLKTHTDTIDALKTAVLEHHPYETPAILISQVETSADFFHFVTENTK